MQQFQQLWQDLPLGRKIAVFTSVLVVLIVLTVTLVTMQPVRASFRAELEAQAGLRLDTLSERLGDPLYLGRIDQIQDIAADTGGHPEVTRFKVYDKNRVLLVDASQAGIYHPADTEPLKPDMPVRAAGDPDFEWREHELIATQTVWTGEDPVGFVQMGFRPGLWMNESQR